MANLIVGQQFRCTEKQPCPELYKGQPCPKHTITAVGRNRGERAEFGDGTYYICDYFRGGIYATRTIPVIKKTVILFEDL